MLGLAVSLVLAAVLPETVVVIAAAPTALAGIVIASRVKTAELAAMAVPVRDLSGPMAIPRRRPLFRR